MKICAKNEHIFKRYQNIDIFFLNAIMILIVRKEDEIVQIINT